jgi:hypothetical protein
VRSPHQRAGRSIPRMEAVAWTALVILAATSFGNIWWLGTRIDAVNARIDANGQRIDANGQRIDAVHDRIAENTDRIEATNRRLDGTNATLRGLSARLDVHIEDHRRGA